MTCIKYTPGNVANANQPCISICFSLAYSFFVYLKLTVTTKLTSICFLNAPARSLRISSSKDFCKQLTKSCDKQNIFAFIHFKYAKLLQNEMIL